MNAYYLILLYIHTFYNKRASSLYSSALQKHKVLRLKESKDEQNLCRVVYIPKHYVNAKHGKFLKLHT